MQRKIISTFLLVLLLTFTFASLMPPQPALAAAPAVPNAYDLMAAVQALRASKGLAPLIVDGALMSAAQGHSNYQASIGTWSHRGAGGTYAVDRARAAGFGGGALIYASENVAIANNRTGLDVVIYQYWSDAAHWNTMTSTRYIYGGAGVTEKDGVMYYTFNTAYIAGQASSGPVPTFGPGAPTAKPKTPIPTMPLMVSIKTSTPNPDGSVVHPVGYGQAMISIATAYGLKLDDLRKLNKMTASSVLRAGQTLVIQASFTPTRAPSSSPTLAPPTQTATPSRTPTSTRAPTLAPSDTPTPSMTPTLTQTSTVTPVSFISSLENIDRRSLGTVIIAVCGMGLLLVVVGQVRRKA